MKRSKSNLGPLSIYVSVSEHPIVGNIQMGLDVTQRVLDDRLRHGDDHNTASTLLGNLENLEGTLKLVVEKIDVVAKVSQSYIGHYLLLIIIFPPSVVAPLCRYCLESLHIIIQGVNSSINQSKHDQTSG